MNTAVVGLGSNIKPEETILKARKLLACQYKVLAESHFLKTKAFGDGAQADFLNGAVLLTTDLSPEQLKTSLKVMEQSLGREDDQHGYVPRIIDLDILVWNGQVVNHDFFERGFIKASVLELLPDLKY